MMVLVLNICIIGVLIAIGFCLVRLGRGPSLADRIVAVDTLAINLVGLTGLLSVRLSTDHFFSLVIVFSLLGFLGTVCIAKYLAGSDLFE